MSLIARTKGGGNFEPVPPGVHVGVCFSVIDLGTQENRAFGNEAHKVLIQWELPEVRKEYTWNGQKVNAPQTVSNRYTLSLHEKASLRQDLESWRGQEFTEEELAGFDLHALLGAACQLQIVHQTSESGRIYSKIAAIMALPKGTPCPKAENPPLVFAFEEDGSPASLPANLPQWIAKIIHESKEWRGTATPPTSPGAASGVDESDDVPF